MSFRRTHRFFPVAQLRDEVDRLLGDFFGAPAGSDGGSSFATRGYPPVNVWERGDEFLIEAELPGLNIEDVQIEVVGNELTLKGSRPGPEESATPFHRKERGHGPFARVLRLPAEVDAEKTRATLKDGVLTVVTPKSAAAKPRSVRVELGA